MLTEGQNLHSPLLTAAFLLSDSSRSLSEQMSLQVSAEAALTADDRELSIQSPVYWQNYACFNLCLLYKLVWRATLSGQGGPLLPDTTGDCALGTIS